MNKKRYWLRGVCLSIVTGVLVVSFTMYIFSDRYFYPPPFGFDLENFKDELIRLSILIVLPIAVIGGFSGQIYGRIKNNDGVNLNNYLHARSILGLISLLVVFIILCGVWILPILIYNY